MITQFVEKDDPYRVTMHFMQCVTTGETFATVDTRDSAECPFCDSEDCPESTELTPGEFEAYVESCGETLNDVEVTG